ncbi:hypothetical protein LXL04_001383 [Taraxacum kok-saghyz]
MNRCINSTILPDDEEIKLEKKRKTLEMNECCVVMGLGSSNSKEQQLLEAAAFHLILLSNNPLQKSYDCNKGYDSDGRTDNISGGFRMITPKKKKQTKRKRQDYGVEGVVKFHENDGDANSVTSSSSSSSAETVKSGISSVSMEENEVEDKKGTADHRVLQQGRMRSIVDIYDVTTRL